MNINIKWHQPIPLKDGNSDLIYMMDEAEIESWDGCPGVYMFCRLFNSSIIPLYIGRSQNIANRIWAHLETTSLMRRIENNPKGAKSLIIGEYISQPGQSSEKALRIVERP